MALAVLIFSEGFGNIIFYDSFFGAVEAAAKNYLLKIVLVFFQWVLKLCDYLMIFHQGRWGWIHIDFGHINSSPIVKKTKSPQDIFSTI